MGTTITELPVAGFTWVYSGLLAAAQHGLAGECHLPSWGSMTRACTLVALVLLSFASTAGEVLELSVTNEQGQYTLRIVAVLDAPENYVYNVITDYKHAYRINPTITSVDISPSDDKNVVRVQNSSKHRIGPFSFEVAWAGDIVETGHGSIHITTIPEISSFDSGSALWEINTLEDRTYVLHESSMKPKFFIPPIIGSYVMKKHMKKEALAIFDRIERLAQIMLDRDRDRDRREDPAQLKLVSGETDSRLTSLGYKKNYVETDQ
jgi:hypothetical protein